ncbi:YheO-like PAS domain protein [Acidaminobacter sp. JC074]|uniref:helix-turn-helix transcriptional regulator n=1 Tax=Acidaminobacter sp. JC074 TaxID=2530199 RepID=UPI001F0CEE74|nr:PAS domain-containing protein [Acidaminobacter sp. JC074]MCH4887942.1 YheO-like PAS domain protein [Acidaminobacter sp. JC074]
MTEDNYLLNQYKIIVEFLGEILGDNVEIVLHDLTDLEESIIAISNGHISGRKLGGPVTDLALRMIKDVQYKNINYMTDYRSVSRNGKSFHSSTLLIRNHTRTLIGMLCFNFDFGDYYSIKKSIENILPQYLKNQEDHHMESHMISEKLNDSIEHLVSHEIHEMNVYKNYEPKRLVQEEKIDIIRTLHDKGVFLIKGAVIEVASQLRISEATVYRYLSMIKREV